MEWTVETLRRYPEIAIFLTLALGFALGGLKLGRFTLGNVTGVLLAGVLIGQLHIVISPDVSAVFFLMFLFAVGYGIGPQFFRGLKRDGLAQVLFAVVLCVACLLATLVAAKLAGYNIGQAAGLLSGACTISAVLGVAPDAINQLGLAAGHKQALLEAMPVAYAVTYLFGTAGSAWFLAVLGPKLLRVDLAKECADYEAKLGGGPGPDEEMLAYHKRTIRSYRVAEHSRLVGKTVKDFEARFASREVFVERIRQDGRLLDPNLSIAIRPGDVLALAGLREALLQQQPEIGPEVDDPELLCFPGEILDVVITRKEIAGQTLKEIAESEAARKHGRGVFLRKLTRGGQELPIAPATRVDRGDVVQLVGAVRDVERAAALLGYPDRATEKTDVVFMGLGIALGGLVGAMAVHWGSVPLSLSTSGGTLIAGLVCGWLRAVHPTFGRIPAPALWILNDLALTLFIAVVGLSTGPSFLAGLKQSGLSLFLWGAFVTIAPLVFGLLAGKYLFKMHPGILLGACAGVRTTTAALSAIQEEAKSKVPALGYSITYAVGNTLLIVCGVLIVLLMK
jgi:putative transport protein